MGLLKERRDERGEGRTEGRREAGEERAAFARHPQE